MYANIWMTWGCFKSNSDVTSPDSSTQTSKISKLHSSTHVHQRPVSKIPKNDVCKFQTESEVIIFTNPTPPVFWRANLPKSLYICLVLIPQKMGNFMTHAKKKIFSNKHPGSSATKWPYCGVSLTSTGTKNPLVSTTPLTAASIHAHIADGVGSPPRKPRRRKVVCLLCAFFLDAWVILLIW